MKLEMRNPHGWGCCPRCKNRNIDYGEKYYVDGERLEEEVICSECGMKFKDVFDLHYILSEWEQEVVP